MIILDTNVVSELARGRQADAGVLSWLRKLDEQPVTTVLNKAELLAGIALLPAGSKRTALTGAIQDVLADLTICLPLTSDCSAAYAEIVALRVRMGRPIATMDALIASVARVNDAAVATRDVGGFDGLGLRLINPWDA